MGHRFAKRHHTINRHALSHFSFDFQVAATNTLVDKRNGASFDERPETPGRWDRWEGLPGRRPIQDQICARGATAGHHGENSKYTSKERGYDPLNLPLGLEIGFLRKTIISSNDIIIDSQRGLLPQQSPRAKEHCGVFWYRRGGDSGTMSSSPAVLPSRFFWNC